jgi:hypothetical protein
VYVTVCVLSVRLRDERCRRCGGGRIERRVKYTSYGRLFSFQFVPSTYIRVQICGKGCIEEV